MISCWASCYEGNEPHTIEPTVTIQSSGRLALKPRTSTMPARKATQQPPKSKTNGEDVTMGSLRLAADRRQFSGMLMLTGFCAVIMPLFQISTDIEANGGTPTSGVAFASFIGAILVLIMGIVSVFVGFAETVFDLGRKGITAAAIILSQTAWLAYISRMVEVGIETSTGHAFIPEEYDYSRGDVSFIGAMGIVGLAAYGFSFVGSIAFFHFSMYACQAGKPHHRNSSYFRSRQRFYAFILYVAGVNQFALGAYCYFKFGDLIKEHGPIMVGFYVVNYPTFTLVAGGLQLILGTWCFLRTFGFFLKRGQEHYFPIGMGIGWLSQLGLQILPQIGVLPGPSVAGLSATVTAFGLGLYLMPAYLDYKTRTTNQIITADYYGLDETSESARKAGSTRESLSELGIDDIDLDEIEMDLDELRLDPENPPARKAQDARDRNTQSVRSQKSEATKSTTSRASRMSGSRM